MKNVIFPYSPKEAEEKGITDLAVVNINALFPTRMRKLRELKGLRLGKPISQKEAAKEMGFTRSTLGLYETGANVPDIKTIVRIAEYYDTTVNYLLGIDERPTYENSYIAKNTGLSDESIKILMNEISSGDEKSQIIDSVNHLLSTQKGRRLLNDIWIYVLGDIVPNQDYIFFNMDNANTSVALNLNKIRLIYLTSIQDKLIKMREDAEKEKQNENQA